MKNFYTAKEVKEILNLGHIRTAHYRIQSLNEELKAQGYWIELGKVPVSFFHEKYPYVETNEIIAAKPHEIPPEVKAAMWQFFLKTSVPRLIAQYEEEKRKEAEDAENSSDRVESERSGDKRTNQ